MEQYTVTGMSCAACQNRVEKAVSGVPGVTVCSVSLLTNSMGVEGTADPRAVIEAVTKAGYGAALRGAAPERAGGGETFSEAQLQDSELPKRKKRLIASVIVLVVLMYITMGHHMLGLPLPSWIEGNVAGLAVIQLLLAAIVMIINGQFFTGGFRSLLHGTPNMDTLVALGSTVSFAWSVVILIRIGDLLANGAPDAEIMELYHNSLYFESAAMIPALITVGKLLESLSKGRTTNALRSLMRLAPKTATLIRDGKKVEVAIEEVRVGDAFAVRPGEAVPVDGVITDGESALDESALTGESVPVDKGVGDRVSAGTFNRSGYLQCSATRVGEDTTLSQVIRMVSDAAATKAPIARIADRVSGVFVPVVIAIALVVIVGWLIAGESATFALARGISVLVISCPCALGLATPVAIMVGNGVGAKNGILFKTGEALEQAGKVDIVVLDKTGTLTEGTPSVTDILPAEGCTEEELLRKAGLLESRSEHPLARAVVARAAAAGAVGSAANENTEVDAMSVGAAGKAGDPGTAGKAMDASTAGTAGNAGNERVEITDFRALPGNGVTASLAGHRLLGGSGSFLTGEGILDPEWKERGDALSVMGKTPLYFAEDGRLIGIIAVADTLRTDSKDAVRQLQKLGTEVVMLTGDNERTAKAIAEEAGVRHVVAGVLPDGKEAVVRALQSCGRVAMVGDGINDAPALTRADTGIAIGAGTDVAIDSADIVLMNSSLSDVAAAIRLSRGTLRNIHQNLFWAFFYNMLCIPLAAGLFPWKLNPMIGAAAMSLSSFTVCMNALRLNLLKPKDPGKDRPARRKKTIEEEVTKAIEVYNEEKERRTNMTKTVSIRGMMCGHCEATVKKALEALDFVEEAVVSHDSGTAVLTVSGEVDEAAVRAAVEAKDFEYCGIA